MGLRLADHLSFGLIIYLSLPHNSLLSLLVLSIVDVLLLA